MISLHMNGLGQREPCLSAHDVSNLGDRIEAMKQQEQTMYKCRDYILRRKRESLSSLQVPPSPSSGVDFEKQESQPDLSDVDVACREKMCEWSFRVIDHFQASREIVAVSFSYLDRFVDRCSCDRTAFKLAAITTLHIATKIFNPREISMASLAELSRGEFAIEHIAEMEGIILQSLSWQMHPPTSASFIDYFMTLLRPAKEYVRELISQKAYFFAELSTFEYAFVTQRQSAVALAAILNGMESLKTCELADSERRDFLNSLRDVCGMNHRTRNILSIRDRLWRLYRRSEHFKVHESSTVLSCDEDTTDRFIQKTASGDESPVCVSHVP